MMLQQTTIIWDLDGVKYSYDSYPGLDYYALCDEANAITAMQVLPWLNHGEAEALAKESYERFSDCYGAFMPLADKAGLSEDQLRLNIFKGYHVALFGLLQEKRSDFFDHAATGLVEAFEKGKTRNIKHGVLSHSCMNGWGKPVLNVLGILPYFQENAVLGMDDFGFQRKGESAEPLRQIISLLDAKDDIVWFAEDSLRNLEKAKDIPGIKTAYIHQGKPKDTLPAYVDVQCRNPVELLNHVLK